VELLLDNEPDEITEQDVIINPKPSYKATLSIQHLDTSHTNQFTPQASPVTKKNNEKNIELILEKNEPIYEPADIVENRYEVLNSKPSFKDILSSQKLTTSHSNQITRQPSTFTNNEHNTTNETNSHDLSAFIKIPKPKKNKKKKRIEIWKILFLMTIMIILIQKKSFRHYQYLLKVQK